MRKRNIAIIIGSTLAIALPISAFIAVSVLSTMPKISSSYIYKPESESSIALQKQVSDALDATIGTNGVLDLQFDTLTKEAQYTSSQNAWFSELASAFQWIDPRLSFQRNPRNNALVERAHFNGDTMMRSFFWSADYHNVGTWVGYNFTDQFAITNLYPSLFQYSEDFRKDSNNDRFITREYDLDVNGELNVVDGRPSGIGNPFPGQYQVSNWLPDLATHLSTFPIPQNFIDGYNNAPASEKEGLPTSITGLAPSRIIIMPNTVINAPYLYSWEELSRIDRAIQIGLINSGEKPGTLLLRDLIWNQIGYWADVQTSKIESEQYWIGLVTWINQQGTAIPYVSESGPDTATVTLAKENLHPVKNPNTEINFLDWFTTDSNKNSYTSWWETNPFDNAVTPFNPTFSRAPNNLFFQSTRNGLLSYKTTGDWKAEADGTLTPPKVDLFLQGAESIDLKDSNGTLIHTIGGKKPDPKTWLVNPSDVLETANATIYEFKIPTGDKVFQWMSGNTPMATVTAQDYFTGLLTFILSADWNYNSNGYYTSLFNLDIEKTIESNNHFFSNRPAPGQTYRSMTEFKMLPSKPEENIFTIVQTAPNVNTLGILTRQYFEPLPTHNSGVKYILQGVDGKQQPFLKEGSEGGLNVDDKVSGFTNIYGGTVDNGSNISNWWSAGPYSIQSSNGTTEMVFQKNEKFFNNFPKDFFRANSEKQIDQIIMKYGKGFSVQNTFEQFKVGETDISKIPQGNLPEVFQKFPNDIRIIGTEFLSRTDLLSFNTDVYELDRYGAPRLENGDKILKPFITESYEKAIIDDLHLGKEGNSYKLRNGILELIDWYSLSSLATPNNVPYYQNSIVPYGNALINNDDGTRETFFDVSLNKGHIGFTGIPYLQYAKNWQEQLG